MSKILDLVHMIGIGMQGISLNRKRNYRRHIKSNLYSTFEERWTKIGQRLNEAIEKVTKETLP